MLSISGFVSLLVITAAQLARALGLDFSPLSWGVPPDGTELPDLTGDTLDLDTPPAPKRAGGMPLPADAFDPPANAPVKKKKKAG